MKELIKIETKDGSQVVSARELHQFLDMQSEFPKWCKRMFEYGFVENQDYVEVTAKKDDNSKGGKNTLIEYALTLDCAKQIAMLQRNEKGWAARQYFIACEKQLLESFKLSKSFSELPHVSRIKEINILIAGLETQKAVLKSEIVILNKLPQLCKFCGKKNENHISNIHHENYCKENPNALLSPNAKTAQIKASKEGGSYGK